MQETENTKTSGVHEYFVEINLELRNKSPVLKYRQNLERQA